MRRNRFDSGTDSIVWMEEGKLTAFDCWDFCFCIYGSEHSVQSLFSWQNPPCRHIGRVSGGIQMSAETYMALALSLAEKGAGRVSPNPMVGAVIVKKGRIIGEGWHQRYGGLHAERNALADCRNRGEDPAGAEMYVTLEPCCHYGKTLPCTEAIIDAGITRVITGSDDPNPLVAGKGLQILREHGIDVKSNVLKDRCDRLNRVFFHYITHHTPYVVMKYAMTMDGKIAAYTGASQWITGEAARKNVQKDRNRYSAIMAGIGTVLADDPLLTCRIEGGRNPVRIICDTHLRIPLSARLVQTAAEIPTILAAGITEDPAIAEKAAALKSAGCQVMFIPTGEDGHLFLPALMQELGKIGIDSILLEGGSRLNWAALSSGLVHLVQSYIAPKLLGGETARSPVGGQGFPDPQACIHLAPPSVQNFGGDILLESEVILSCSQES